jgi:Tfp pilus assembly protein PilV
MMRRAFSLIELLLAVFILAIEIISVSALFPAGIAQQQQTTDDQLGPVVAEQALGRRIDDGDQARQGADAAHQHQCHRRIGGQRHAAHPQRIRRRHLLHHVERDRRHTFI